jgi:hypothetical protein
MTLPHASAGVVATATSGTSTHPSAAFISLFLLLASTLMLLVLLLLPPTCNDLQVWGPKRSGDMPQYRRKEKLLPLQKSKWEGAKEGDLSTVFGIWLPADGWQIYAQCLRRRRDPNRSYVVVEVWRLWPTVTTQGPFKMWPDAN